ncbi:hypothetical protein [Streptomyces sp. NPDC048623]|uniref:hypothetical protein n=1 Tax=Streptomyces sp. NPDC048623 TaxID=3155761 RepID=UPI00343D74B5
MSQSTVQFLLALLGITGTLAAAITTQVLQRRAERDRREADDARRWHADRFRASKDLLYKVMETERILWSACAMLPNTEERGRLRSAGHTSLTVVQGTDVPTDTGDIHIFDAVSLEIVKEALERAFALLEEAEHLVAEISILSEEAVPAAAKSLFEAAWEATGAVETTAGTTDEAFDAVLAMKDPLAAFEQCVRVELGVTKATTPRRPPPSQP